MRGTALAASERNGEARNSGTAEVEASARRVSILSSLVEEVLLDQLEVCVPAFHWGAGCRAGGGNCGLAAQVSTETMR